MTKLQKERLERYRKRLEMYYEAEEAVLLNQEYTIGTKSLKRADLSTIRAAIKDLEKAVFYNSENGDALFALGNSYRKNGDEDKAKEIYNKVIELLPGSERARRSQAYLDEMDAQ